MNDEMKLFNGDIVFSGYSFGQNHNKQYFGLLICGFIRRDTNEYVIPKDIVSKCAMFVDYGSFPVHQILESKRYCILIKLLSEGINSNNDKRRFKVVQLVRYLSSLKDPPLQTIIDSGIVTKLLPFLQDNENIDHKLQQQIAWIFTNICTGTEEHTQYIIDIGSVPLFVNMIKSTSYLVQEQSIWALGNIAGENLNSRNLVLDNDILQHFVSICKNYLQLTDDNQGICVLRNIAWVLSNLSGKDERPRWKYIEQIMECLFYLLKTNDTETLWRCGEAFDMLVNYITGDYDMLIAATKNMGFITVFINLLDNKSLEVQHSMLNSINNILVKTDMITEHVINCGILKKLHFLLKTDMNTFSEKIVICYIISNIIVDSTKAEQVIQANIFPLLIDILQNGDHRIADEALWAIGNAIVRGSNKEISYLVNLNALSAICAYLKRATSTDVIFKSLCCLENVLETENNEYKNYIKDCGGLETLQSMQRQSNDDLPEIIDEKLFNILKHFP
eukprot:244581_1